MDHQEILIKRIKNLEQKNKTILFNTVFLILVVVVLISFFLGHYLGSKNQQDILLNELRVRELVKNNTLGYCFDPYCNKIFKRSENPQWVIQGNDDII